VTALLVLLGGAAGAVARFVLGRALPGRPGTFAVNVVGSLALGLLAEAAPDPYALLGIGFCGALTTFSTYALETLEGGGWRYVLSTTAACLGACALGLWIS
jgi:CrcB protein